MYILISEEVPQYLIPLWRSLAKKYYSNNDQVMRDFKKFCKSVCPGLEGDFFINFSIDKMIEIFSDNVKRGDVVSSKDAQQVLGMLFQASHKEFHSIMHNIKDPDLKATLEEGHLKMNIAKVIYRLSLRNLYKIAPHQTDEIILQYMTGPKHLNPMTKDQLEEEFDILKMLLDGLGSDKKYADLRDVINKILESITNFEESFTPNAYQNALNCFGNHLKRIAEKS